MKIAFFDTETTGLLKSSASKLENQPYIIELYCCVLDTDNEWNVINEFNHLILPPIPIPEKITSITGINDEMLVGKPSFTAIFQELAALITGTDMLVAHNLPFDKGMLCNELKRIDKDYSFPWPRHQVCTIEKSKDIKGYRLNLTKLHYLATGKGFKAHRASDDVKAMVRSFFWLVKEKHIKLEDYK